MSSASAAAAAGAALLRYRRSAAPGAAPPAAMVAAVTERPRAGVGWLRVPPTARLALWRAHAPPLPGPRAEVWNGSWWAARGG
eukprot:gene24542-61782_t